jgi:hypothetical protein
MISISVSRDEAQRSMLMTRTQPQPTTIHMTDTGRPKSRSDASYHERSKHERQLEQATNTRFASK